MPPRIILHAGTPKTGTSSLQTYLESNRDDLGRQGILYPRTAEPAARKPTHSWMVAPLQSHDARKPKHQWMVAALLARDPSGFVRGVERTLAEARPDTQTVILSAEGLFHLWWDFSSAGRQALSALAQRFPVELWVWFRDPVAFVRSSYIQMLKNPRGGPYCYGRDLSVDEMLDDPWFARHLDYAGFLEDAARVLGSGTITPFAYQGDTVTAMVEALGADASGRAPVHENASPGSLGVALLRRVNRYGLASGRRKTISVSAINMLDSGVGAAGGRFTLAASTERRIRDLAAESMRTLERDHGLVLGGT